MSAETAGVADVDTAFKDKPRIWPATLDNQARQIFLLSFRRRPNPALILGPGLRGGDTARRDTVFPLSLPGDDRRDRQLTR